jgi:FkbM family methyltransferase
VISRILRNALRAFGVEVSRYTPVSDRYQNLCYFAEKHGVNTIFDVGANSGQFAQRMFESGWRGRIVSFEPLTAAHAALKEMAKRHANWDVASRMALGSSRGIASINIAQNSQSSSLLPMLERHLTAAPDSAYTGTEDVDVITLLEAADEYSPSESFMLKMDVQGFEREVLRGAAECLQRCPIIFTEVSLQPLYDGEPLFTELAASIIQLGYRCVGIRPGYYDGQNREIIQADATFVR